MLLKHTAHHGKHQQRERVGHYGAAHRYAHTVEPRQAVAQHNGVGYQRVRGIHGGHQHRSGRTIAQHRVGGIANAHRYDKTEQTERGGAPLDALHVLQVHLERGKEHDVVKPHLAKQLKAGVALKHTEPVGADEHAGKYHAHYRGHAQLVEQHGRKEYDAQHNEEYPGRVCYQGL